jgi:hypothetical protein
MLATALALVAIQASAPSCTTADPRVETMISSKSAEVRGQEYCQFRLYHTIDDFDGDGEADFLVVFAIEGLGGGGNNHVPYLAAFLSGSAWKPMMVQVGQRGVRTVSDISVDRGIIVLATAEQRRRDALCCPSGKGELRYALRDGQLLAVRAGRPTKR